MAKTLCQRKKTLKRDLATYAALVAKPRFLCANCGRAARKKKHLCEPMPLEPQSR